MIQIPLLAPTASHEGSDLRNTELPGKELGLLTTDFSDDSDGIEFLELTFWNWSKNESHCSARESMLALSWANWASFAEG